MRKYETLPLVSGLYLGMASLGCSGGAEPRDPQALPARGMEQYAEIMETINFIKVLDSELKGMYASEGNGGQVRGPYLLLPRDDIPRDLTNGFRPGRFDRQKTIPRSGK